MLVYVCVGGRVRACNRARGVGHGIGGYCGKLASAQTFIHTYAYAFMNAFAFCSCCCCLFSYLASSLSCRSQIRP